MTKVKTVASLRHHLGKWWAYQASDVGIHWDSKWNDKAVKEIRKLKVKIIQIIIISSAWGKNSESYLTVLI